MAGRRTTPRVEAAAVRRYNMAATWLEYAGDINGLQRCGTYLFRCTRLLPPFVVWQLVQGLQRIIVSVCEAAVDDPARGARGLGHANICSLKDCPQHAFRRYRVITHEFPVAGQHAAEILRPRTIDGGTQDLMSDMSIPEMLRLWRKAYECVDLSVHEQLNRLDGRLDDPMDVLAGIKPDMRGHDGHQRVRDRPERRHSHASALRSAIVRIPSRANSSWQPTCTPARTVIGSLRSIAGTSDAA